LIEFGSRVVRRGRASRGSVRRTRIGSRRSTPRWLQRPRRDPRRRSRRWTLREYRTRTQVYV